MQSNEYHLRTELSRSGEQLKADVILCKGGQDTIVSSNVIGGDGSQISCENPKLVLRVEGLSVSMELMFAQAGQTDCTERALLCSDLDIRELSTEVAGGFVGCTVGMYAVADVDCREQAACFKSLSYRPL